MRGIILCRRRRRLISHSVISFPILFFLTFIKTNQSFNIFFFFVCSLGRLLGPAESGVEQVRPLHWRVEHIGSRRRWPSVRRERRGSLCQRIRLRRHRSWYVACSTTTTLFLKYLNQFWINQSSNLFSLITNQNSSSSSSSSHCF